MLQARDTYSVLYGRVKSADEEEPSRETLSVVVPDKIPPISSTSPLGSPQQRCWALLCRRVTAVGEKVPLASLSQERLGYWILGNIFSLTLLKFGEWNIFTLSHHCYHIPHRSIRDTDSSHIWPLAYLLLSRWSRDWTPRQSWDMTVMMTFLQRSKSLKFNSTYTW